MYLKHGVHWRFSAACCFLPLSGRKQRKTSKQQPVDLHYSLGLATTCRFERGKEKERKGFTWKFKIFHPPLVFGDSPPIPVSNFSHFQSPSIIFNHFDSSKTAGMYWELQGGENSTWATWTMQNWGHQNGGSSFASEFHCRFGHCREVCNGNQFCLVFNRRENRHSLAILDRKGIAHLGALKIARFCWER